MSTASPTDVTVGEVVHDVSFLGDQDLHLFNEGRHFRLWEKLGAHPLTHEGREGVHFAVWAPNASRVSVIGDFNGWEPDRHPLAPVADSGVWAGFLPGAGDGVRYKYRVVGPRGKHRADKADPFALCAEVPPATASVVREPSFEWGDEAWMEARGERFSAGAPVSVYEVHLGSWARRGGPRPPGVEPEEWSALEEGDGEHLSYREIAPLLARHVKETGFTHVELLPVMEHPFYGSWGYQTTGYFAPTARYGEPEGFMFLVDHLHRNGIGVILDWVPSHFPTDEHGLGYFDGTHLYEPADPREGFHPDWNSYIFDYGRPQVRSFLVSSALFWLDAYHADGLRVDAVASMLYRDYSRREGEWIPNEHGGRENLEAIRFLRTLNEEIDGRHPDVQTVAEESTAWPMVSGPTYVGGLGFGLKWDMGWMHDTLAYFGREPTHRPYHHDEVTFRMVYAFSENFMLPLSHDEVVHGKGSLLRRMAGDEWRKRAHLRLLFAYMFAQPGKKLLFMGGELGQRREWSHDASLEWSLLDDEGHRGLLRWVRDLNRLYRERSPLHALDFEPRGFEWVEVNDAERSVFAFLRRDGEGRSVLCVFNCTPVPRENYRFGVPEAGTWVEILNSDADTYGGSGWGNLGEVEATPVPYHGRHHSLNLTLPPLSAVFLQSRETLDASPESERTRAQAPDRERRPGSMPRSVSE